MKLHDEHINFTNEVSLLENKISQLISENNKLKSELENYSKSKLHNYIPIDDLPVSLFTSDKTGSIFYCNDEMKKLLNIGDSDIKLNIFDFIMKEDLEKAKQNFARILSGEKLSSTVYKCIKPNNEKIKLVFKTKKLPVDKNTTGLVSTILSTSESNKFAEKDIQKSEELFKGIYENASVGIFRVSKDDNNNIANPALLNLLGYASESEILKDSNNRWLPSLDGFIRFLDIQFSSRNKCVIERKFKKPDNEFINIKAVIRRIKEAGSDNYYYEGIVEDITNQKALEQVLIDAKENAEKSDRLKSEFFAQMSHEIRTPINTILSFSSLVEEEISNEVSEELQMSFDYIHRSGNRIIRTMDLILHMSELQTGTYEFIESSFDVYSDVIENLYPQYLMSAKEKGIKFIITNQVNDPIINGDKSSITRIFHNLIENAIKYTKEGKVSVNVSQTIDSKVMVEVKDSGIGIAKNYLDSLFKPFTQEDQGYTRKFEGNGLGLALVNKYAELNNAKIEVESDKGIGSIFRVIFN